MALYIELADANEYFASRLNTDAWDLATDDLKSRALQSATDIIDLLNIILETAADIPSVDIACAEIAISLLDGIDPSKEYENLNLVSAAYSSTRLAYDRTNPPDYITAGVPSIVAWRLLVPFVRSPYTIKVIRGD